MPQFIITYTKEVMFRVNASNLHAAGEMAKNLERSHVGVKVLSVALALTEHPVVRIPPNAR